MPDCEIVHEDKKAGLKRLCQTGVAAKAVKRLDGQWWCKACLKDLHRALEAKGVGYLNRVQAMARIGRGDE